MATNDSTTIQQFKTFHGNAPGKAYTSADIGAMQITAGLQIAYIQLKKPFLIGFAEVSSNIVNLIEAAEAVKSEAFLGCFHPDDRPAIQFWGSKAAREPERAGYFINER